MKREIERIANIETEARRLANSGAFNNFVAVRRELIASGYKEAWKMFNNPWTQSEIDRLCTLARSR